MTRGIIGINMKEGKIVSHRRSFSFSLLFFIFYFLFISGGNVGKIIGHA